MKTRTVLFVVAILAIGSAMAAEKPNIILIMLDDLGYADISPYGQTKIETPHLSRMAEGGLTFTQFYAGVSVCAPSRSSLMEGLHTGHCYIRNNKQLGERNGQWPIPADTVIIPKALKEAGYATGMIGKWGLGNPGTSGDPLLHGWDFYYGYTDQVLAHNYFPDHLLKNGVKVPLDNEPVWLPEKFDGLGSYTPDPKEYSHDYLMEETLRFIEEKAGTPFFLYLPYTIPHDNGEQSEENRFEVPSQGFYADKPWTKQQKDYAAMITYMDEGIGEILAAVAAAGIAEDTLVLFCSDNGPLKKHSVTEFFDSNGPFQGGKRDLYEGGIRSPLIAWWPGVVEASTNSDHICAAWDIFPTFCDLAGVAVPDGLDGLSLLPTLTGEGEQAKHESLYWEFHTNNAVQAVRLGDWKGIRFNTGVDAEAPIRLFNLPDDVGETKDVAAKHPDVVSRIAHIMEAAHVPSKLFPFAREKK